MTYSFNNSSSEKFQQISGSQFQEDSKLLSNAPNITLQTQLIKPAAIMIITNSGKKRIVSDESVEIKPGQKLVYDLGSLYVGYFTVKCQSVGSPMDAPLLLKTRFAEIQTELNIDASQIKSWLPLSWIQDDIQTIEVLPNQLSYRRRFSCRYICLEPIGQSLKWQPEFKEPIFKAESAVLNDTVKPLKHVSQWIQDIDQACIKTLRNTMQEVFEDGTKRDQRLWVSDFEIQAKVNYATFNNHELPKRCLYLLGSYIDDKGRLPADVLTRLEEPVADDLFWFDYELLFIVALKEYMCATSDESLLSNLYPVAKRAFKFIQDQLTNTSTVGNRKDIFIDWSTHFNKETAVQAELLMAISSFIELAQLSNDKDVKLYTQFFVQVKKQSLTECYNYNEHQFTSGSQKEINPLSQIFMLLTDLLPEKETQLVIDRLQSQFDLEKILTTPSTQGLLAEALFKHNRSDEALTVIKNYWGGMLRQGSDTFWEVFDKDNLSYSPYGSPLLNGYCFGWSSYPSHLFRKYLQ